MSSRRRTSGWWSRVRAKPWLGTSAGILGAALIGFSLYLYDVGGGRGAGTADQAAVLSAVAPPPTTPFAPAVPPPGTAPPTPTVWPSAPAPSADVPPATTGEGPAAAGTTADGGSRSLPPVPKVLPPRVTRPTAVATTGVTAQPSPPRTGPSVQPPSVQPPPVHTEQPPPPPPVTPTPSTGVPVPTQAVGP
ncbi:hypothetical protein [Protofrankia sp. BMG5.30]|uniref:hypothetical protein n=1 Tax=Protofrankia sp. BMG5.30 TaxID=1834514 RepID=UPI00097803C9|nr:hypothetical protein [Protofrankia sp. BMG5.30]ONH36999.1 hypothetical protein BL254_04865 [Protofrankia sp. BMG5.30]